MTAALVMPKKKEVVFRCNLQRMMDERGLTQVALSEATGLSIATIRNLCRSNFSRIDCKTTADLMLYFDCEFSDLFEVSKR